jgi:membrane protein
MGSRSEVQDSPGHGFRGWLALLVRGAKEAKADSITDVAAALSYYAFLAIPAVLLVAVGVFSQVAGPETIESILNRLEGIVPEEAIALLEDSLTRAIENESGGIVLIIIGFLLALWTASGAMNALMRGLNHVYEREETRGFVRQRLIALAMFACLLLSFGLAFGLLVLGGPLSRWIGGALDAEGIVSGLWWALQWPLLVVALLAAFAVVLYLGPDVQSRRWTFLTPGAIVALVVWLLASGLFAVYVSLFSSYNKAWGSLAGVIIMLTWLWLSALALLLGAEVNAVADREQESHRGEPAEAKLRAQTQA